MANAKRIDGLTLKEMFISGAALLTQNREAIDALNVFPVPDGDTGTNMSQTINAAVKELNSARLVGVGDVADAVARGSLKGARGNSGVILSQIFRGMARALDGAEDIDSELFVRMLKFGAETAYKAVMKPKEGTILTVERVISEDIEKAARGITDVHELFKLVLSSGEAILKRTPEMLPVLKQAGVVDSGGMGLMVIYRGMYAALTGMAIEATVQEAVVTHMPGDYVDDHDSLTEITYGYCTEFIVSHPRPEMRDTDVVRLRKRLERIGDCVLVISDLSVVKVHVHTNDPGKALQYALELGELDALKIENMREEFRVRMEAKLLDEESRMKDYGIVAVALGDGLTGIFNELAVDKIVDGGQTMNPSIEDLFEAIESTHAKTVFVLPNNTNIILAAQQAAELTKKNVYVLPTKSVPMGIAAALAFDAELSAEDNERNMREAAESVHTASITFAVRDTVFDDRQIHAGDIMGLLDNKLEVLGDDIKTVACDVCDIMVNDESGMITIYYGSDVDEIAANELYECLGERFPDCDIELHSGGQPLYYYLIAVE